MHAASLTPQTAREFFIAPQSGRAVENVLVCISPGLLNQNAQHWHTRKRRSTKRHETARNKIHEFRVFRCVLFRVVSWIMFPCLSQSDKFRFRGLFPRTLIATARGCGASGFARTFWIGYNLTVSPDDQTLESGTASLAGRACRLSQRIRFHDH